MDNKARAAARMALLDDVLALRDERDELLAKYETAQRALKQIANYGGREPVLTHLAEEALKTCAEYAA